MSAWTNLQLWPDVPDAINALRKAGLQLAFVSNMTASALNDGLKRARLDDKFEAVLSTDRIRSYKPDPRAYRMVMDELSLPSEEVLFVAFAGWDVVGAKWFGYSTFWLNRLGSPTEELGAEADASGPEADASGPDLNSLVQFVLSKATGSR
jgi:2-haloacid dehalogenase